MDMGKGVQVRAIHVGRVAARGRLCVMCVGGGGGGGGGGGCMCVFASKLVAEQRTKMTDKVTDRRLTTPEPEQLARMHCSIQRPSCIGDGLHA